MKKIKSFYISLSANYQQINYDDGSVETFTDISKMMDRWLEEREEKENDQ